MHFFKKAFFTLALFPALYAPDNNLLKSAANYQEDAIRSIELQTMGNLGIACLVGVLGGANILFFDAEGSWDHVPEDERAAHKSAVWAWSVTSVIAAGGFALNALYSYSIQQQLKKSKQH